MSGNVPRRIAKNCADTPAGPAGSVEFCSTKAGSLTSCPRGTKLVESAEECREALATLGVTGAGGAMSTTSMTDYPPGCWAHNDQGYGAYFNSNTVDRGSNGKNMICRFEPKFYNVTLTPKRSRRFHVFCLCLVA